MRRAQAIQERVAEGRDRRAIRGFKGEARVVENDQPGRNTHSAASTSFAQQGHRIDFTGHACDTRSEARVGVAGLVRMKVDSSALEVRNFAAWIVR